ncbi:MAG: NBR1-Ig-like domain-containing protein, partial [Chloroflexota bacterium]
MNFLRSILNAILSFFNGQETPTAPTQPTTTQPDETPPAPPELSSPQPSDDGAKSFSPAPVLENAAGSNEAKKKTKVFSKIGFHTGPGGNPSGIGDWMRAYDSRRIPFMIKSVDSYGPVFEASELAKKSGVEHLLVYRLSTVGQSHRYDYDVPPYKDPKFRNDPEGGAVKHWRETKKALPPEFDKERTWIEPINEVDKDLCDWLGRFGVHIANLAHAEGYKVSLFAWSSGEPEREGWEQPGMLDYLRLCAERPNQAAVALHEYSYVVDNIKDGYPYKIGRFQMLFDVCDNHGIARPTIHITEWGWTLNNVPEPSKALQDMKEIGDLYAKYPEIKGAAIWYLGPSFGGIANKAQKLIRPAQNNIDNLAVTVDLSKQHPIDSVFDEELEPVIGTPPINPIPGVDQGGEDSGANPGEQPDPTPPEPEPTPPEPEPTPPDPEPTPPEPVPTPPEPVPTPPEPEPVPAPNGVFVSDVTIPDDTRIPTGDRFTKTWQVRNTGNVAWGDGYQFVHIDGKAMTNTTTMPLPNARPGEVVEISINFTVPNEPGIHFSDWRFQDPNGNLFGDIVYVRIIAEQRNEAGVSNSAYVADLTIPDDMELPAGTSVVKTWRVRNSGTRTWGPGYSLNFIEGVAMTSQLSHALPTVLPGETADISLKLTVPTELGTHYCDWKMKDEAGQLFGDIFYMRVKVVEAKEDDTSDPEEVAPSDPHIEDGDESTTAVNRLQTGMNINPDAPHSNPMNSEEFKGLDWVRFVFKVAARVNESERGNLEIAFRQYDRLIATYAKMGVKSMIILNQETVWGKAPWAGSHDWDGYAAEFAEMAGQIAAHYRSYKDRVAFEIWNEGDLDHNAASVYVPPAQFAKILSSSAKAIKRAAPKAIRIFGGLAT